MSTPTQNSVQVTTLSLAALGNDQGALISGYKWGGGWGVGVNLTFSFIPGPPNDFFIDNYGGGIGNGEFGQAYGLSATEQAAVTSALAAWSGIANINFT